MKLREYAKQQGFEVVGKLHKEIRRAPEVCYIFWVDEAGNKYLHTKASKRNREMWDIFPKED